MDNGRRNHALEFGREQKSNDQGSAHDQNNDAEVSLQIGIQFLKVGDELQFADLLSFEHNRL